MIRQRIYGVLFLLISVGIIVRASQGISAEDRDITVTGILVPAGIGLLVTKRRVVYPSDMDRFVQEVAANEH